MRWSSGGAMEPTCIFEAATLHRSIAAVCGCKHASRFEAHCLWWHFQRRGWDDGLVVARQRFWCRVCRSQLRRKVRPVRLDVVVWAAGDFELPWPNELTWKRAAQRVR